LSRVGRNSKPNINLRRSEKDHHDIQKLKTGYIKANNELRSHCEELETLAESKSVAERDYRVAMAKAVMNLNAEGEKATLILSLAKGRIADTKMQRDLSEALYNACRENIKRCHAHIESYRTLVSLAKTEINLK